MPTNRKPRKRRRNKATAQQVQYVQKHLGGQVQPVVQKTPPPEPKLPGLAEQVITWEPASTELTHGESMGTGRFNATALGGAKPEYRTSSGQLVGPTAVPPAGVHAVSVTTAPTGTHAASKEPVVRSFTVKRAPSRLSWAIPAAVEATGSPKSFALTKTQLAAKVERGEPKQEPQYEPAQGKKLAPGTHFLRAVHPQTDNFLRGEITVRLLVHADAKGKAGFEAVRKGGGWKTGVGLPQDVQDRWDKDTDGVRSKGKQLMQDMQQMTCEEMIDHLSKQIGDPSDHKKQGEDHLYRFDNGLQVRVKPKGDSFSSEPKFCIEVLPESLRVAKEFTTKDNRHLITCKLSVDGEPAPKGPGDTAVPKKGKASYKTGTCDATHPVCRPKLEPRLAWTPPAPVVTGTALSSEAQLQARVLEGDGVPTYEPAEGTKMNTPGTVALRATLAASKRYKAGSVSVNLLVQAPPKNPKGK